MAELAGLSERTIRDLESARSEPRPASRDILAEALGLSEVERAEFIGASNKDVAAVVRSPAQLPLGVPDFVGRQPQLTQLADLKGGAFVITAIAGMGGVGKTALALRWAHEVAADFPDGQLYVDLGGHSQARPVRPLEALTTLMRALGVPPDRVPLEQTEAATMFRSTLADRRMLLVLDDAASAEQVRPLLPGSGRCLVLITSRDRLSGLIARDGARRLELDVLPLDEGIALLAAVAGEQRVASEPQAVAELAHACGLLPLALRLAAANLLDRPHQSIADYVTELSGGRLEMLAVPGDVDGAVSSVFHASYRGLEDDSRRVFGLLGLVPGPDLTVAAVAALCGEPMRAARRHLDRLAAAHLVRQDAAGRYRMHDLVHEFAGCVAAQEFKEDTQVAIHRLLDFYLVMSQRVGDLIDADRRRVAVEVVFPPLDVVPISDAQAAWTWLETELPHFVATIHLAAAQGHNRHAWVITYNIMRQFVYKGPISWWIETHEVAVNACRAAGDREGECAIQVNLGHAYLIAGNLDAAMHAMSHALSVARTDGDQRREATCLVYIGQLRQRQGRHEAAIEALERAVAAGRAAKHLRVVAFALGAIADSLVQLGQLTRAESVLREAIEEFRALAHGLGVGSAQHTLAKISNQRGDHRKALDYLRAAMAAARAGGHANGLVAAQAEAAYSLGLLGELEEASQLAEEVLRSAEHHALPELLAVAHRAVALVNQRTGDAAAAVAHYQRAVHWARETGDVAVERQALDALTSLEHQV